MHISYMYGGRSSRLNPIYHLNDQVLVATDLLSRGIDVEGIAWVINFDMPFLPRVARSDDEGNMTDTGVRLRRPRMRTTRPPPPPLSLTHQTIKTLIRQAPETYIHRVGRTGRFGAEGIAVSLISNNQEWRLLQVGARVQRPTEEKAQPQSLTPAPTHTHTPHTATAAEHREGVRDAGGGGADPPSAQGLHRRGRESGAYTRTLCMPSMDRSIHPSINRSTGHPRPPHQNQAKGVSDTVKQRRAERLAAEAKAREEEEKAAATGGANGDSSMS